MHPARKGLAYQVGPVNSIFSSSQAGDKAASNDTSGCGLAKKQNVARVSFLDVSECIKFSVDEDPYQSGGSVSTASGADHQHLYYGFVPSPPLDPSSCLPEHLDEGGENRGTCRV